MNYLTEYCREEFEKFTTFLTSKKCRNWPVFGRNWSIFLVKKVVLVFVTIVTLRQYSVKVSCLEFYNSHQVTLKEYIFANELDLVWSSKEQGFF